MKKVVAAITALTLTLAFAITPVFAQNSETDQAPISTAFSDIKGHWAEETIEKYKSEGIISGYTDGTFRPDNFVTRAEMAKIITLAFDLNAIDDQNSNSDENDKNHISSEAAFDISSVNDIDKNAWYYPYVKASAAYMPNYPLPISYNTNLPFMTTDTVFLPNVNEIRAHAAETFALISRDKFGTDLSLPEISETCSYLLETFKDPEYENLYVMHNGTPAKNAERMFNYSYLANKLSLMQGNADGYFLPYNNISRAELLTIIDRMLSQNKK